MVGRERCVEEEDGRQRVREHCQYSHLNTFFDQYRPSIIPRSLFFLLLLQRLIAKLTNKEKELSKLAEHLDFEKV